VSNGEKAAISIQQSAISKSESQFLALISLSRIRHLESHLHPFRVRDHEAL
jgi:hypothetical protein